MERMNLSLDHIRIDGGTQARAGLSEETLRDYVALLEDGVQFPPVVVFYDGAAYWLADGFHRVEAAYRVADSGIMAEVRSGTRRDAVLYACGANSSHGLRRTRADVQRAIDLLLRDDEWVQWADREIARRVGCTHGTVSRRRAELVASGEIRQIETRLVARNGTHYAMAPAPASQDSAEPFADLRAAVATAGGVIYSVREGQINACLPNQPTRWYAPDALWAALGVTTVAAPPEPSPVRPLTASELAERTPLPQDKPTRTVTPIPPPTNLVVVRSAALAGHGAAWREKVAPDERETLERWIDLVARVDQQLEAGEYAEALALAHVEPDDSMRYQLTNRIQHAERRATALRNDACMRVFVAAVFVERDFDGLVAAIAPLLEVINTFSDDPYQGEPCDLLTHLITMYDVSDEVAAALSARVGPLPTPMQPTLHANKKEVPA